MDFLEAVYQEALEIEFTRRGIPYQREEAAVVYFTGIALRIGTTQISFVTILSSSS